MYEKNKMREYIKNSELRVFNSEVKVRLSKELAIKYDNGSYNEYLNNMSKCLEMISTLGIKYPANARPTLYVYIVPDENYGELLNIPKKFDNGKGGGKPVMCYDLDGFSWAYGLSQNMLENKELKKIGISEIENEIHELSHIVHSQFFSKNLIISEGFAEALPLYALNIEEVFTEHKDILSNLNEGQILNAEEILTSENDNTYGIEKISSNKSCSFRLSYISSYLFVRGSMETIAKKFNLSRAQAVQAFLEIVRESECNNEWLIYDIADSLELSREELLYGKQMQLDLIGHLTTETEKNKI